MKFLFVSLVAISALAFSGCSTNTGDANNDARNAGLNAAGKHALEQAALTLGQAAVDSIFSAAQEDSTAGAKDYVQAAAHGLFQRGLASISSEGVAQVIQVYSAGKAAQTAKAAATIQIGDHPDTVGQAVAAVISTATGAPPAP